MAVRLENYLLRSDVGAYNEINDLILNGHVRVNGVVQKDNNYKVDTTSDFVDVNEKLLNYRRHVYIIMNKPEGYVSADRDRHNKTVLDMLPKWCLRRKMKTVNHLDKDISGLVLITDDVGLYHSVNSLKRQTNMVYHVQTNKPATIKHVDAFASGMRLKHFAGEIATLSKADSYYKGEHAARVTIKESGYFDIKRMFNAVGLQVLSIELLAYGDLVLPIELDIGQWRELKSDELAMLKIRNPYL